MFVHISPGVLHATYREYDISAPRAMSRCAIDLRSSKHTAIIDIEHITQRRDVSVAVIMVSMPPRTGQRDELFGRRM